MAGGESMWKLMGGLLALPVLLVLSVLMIFWGSGDYVRTVQLNWELELPASEGCLYETDSGASFSGDGERYQYAVIHPGADLREFVKHMNDALHGRGGGRSGFAQGSVTADEAAIRAFFCGV